MKKEFDEFVDLIQANIDRCGWIKETTIDEYRKEYGVRVNYEVLDEIKLIENKEEVKSDEE